ncbi:HAD-like domain-containing protein [Triangularia setosa]|uniref:HAD-like domain-containing protein n=1 Tax=Triangularia setosa TaxID=2587417 RepID=A0AAN7A9H7_9PEZI|nr:HAD-like domain-containing protein [Podospora setosa]
MRRLWPIMSAVTSSPWKFAPLKQPFVPSPNTRKLEGIVFDVDGTLCEPQTYMFAAMRSALGIPKSVDILDHVYSLPHHDAQHAAMEKIRAIEREAMLSQIPQPGLSSLMSYLDARSVPKAICTRNFDLPVQNLLDKFLPSSPFAPIVTRDFRPPKPDPAGILHIARSWGLVRKSTGEPGIPVDEGEEKEKIAEGETVEGKLVKTDKGEEVADASGLIMVGDSVDDITAGRRAGAKTVLLVNDVNRHLAEHEHTDLVIERLDELIEVLEEGRL